MTGVLFGLTQYDRVALGRFRAAQERLMLELEPSLRIFRVEEREAIATSQVPVGKQDPVVIEPVRTQRVIRFDPRRVVAGDIAAVLETLKTEARWLADRRIAFMREQLDRVTDATGQTVRASGPMGWDQIMDAVEQAPIGFDDEGRPAFRLWPDEAHEAYERLHPRTPQQERRWEELMERKREEASARERDRRLR